jgi:hypothetical protein
MTQPRLLTLSDVIQTVSACTTSDAELLAVVASLINRGHVRLCGALAGATIDLSGWGRSVPPWGRGAEGHAGPHQTAHKMRRQEEPPADETRGSMRSAITALQTFG